MQTSSSQATTAVGESRAPLPELELQLVARRAERKRQALAILKTDLLRRRSWGGAALVAVWFAIMVAIPRLGGGLAAYLGLTVDGLQWTSIAMFGVLLLGFAVVELNRKVEALTWLLEEER